MTLEEELERHRQVARSRGNDTGRGPKEVGKATERRGRRDRQAENLTLT